MELGLSLGDAAKPFVFMEKPPEAFDHLGLGLNTTLSIGPNITSKSCEEEEEEEAKQKENYSIDHHQDHDEATNDPFYPTVQLDLLPHIPVVARNINPPSQISLPWLSPSQNGEAASSRVLNVKRLLPVAKEAAREEEESEERAAVSWSPPNSGATSSFQMDLCIYSRGGSMSGGKRESDGEATYDQRASSRASDEDDNNGGSTRKKLRLSKEQSAFLEESFKEHHTLNPKQKQALAKQLNLRPRQVEVWFQNRRARTKLKQTEVDCEYLKRCCETLSEENRRLHKELQELRALKTNSNPFFMQLPATTLTMCPSCERVATNPTSSSSATPSSIATTKSTTDSTSKAIGFPLGKKPMFYPFINSQPHQPTAS